MDKDQLFKGTEIEAVLKMAAKLQSDDVRKKEDDASGLSMGDLEKIGQEAGIDPSYIRQAILLADSPIEESRGFELLGGPNRVSSSLVIDRPLSRVEREDLLPLIREIFDSEGHAESLTNSLTWGTTVSTRKGSRQGDTISMTTEGEKTVFRFSSNVVMPGFLIHYIPLLPTFLVSLALLSDKGFPTNGIIIAMLTALMVFGASRFVYGKYADKKARRLAEAKKAIREKTSRAAEMESSPKTQISLDDPDAYGEKSGDESNSQTRNPTTTSGS